MRSLYELTVTAVIKTGIDTSELPETIREEIENYKEHPIPLKFPDIYNAESVIAIAKASQHILNSDDIYQIKRGDLKGYLRVYWIKFCKSFLQYIDTPNFYRKEKARMFKLLYKFFYDNCGVFNGVISSKSLTRFLYNIKERHIALVAIDDWRHFDSDDRQMCSDLWDINAFVISKQHNWREIHDELLAKVLTLNQIYPLELDNLWLRKTIFPFDIIDSLYWKTILKRVRLGEYIDGWEYCIEELEESDAPEKVWYYMDKEIFREFYKNGILYQIDWTMDPPYNLWNDKYYTILLNASLEGTEPWSYSKQSDQNGNWKKQWYYTQKLVYEEGLSDYGYYSHDYTTNIIRAQEIIDAENLIIMPQPRLFVDWDDY